MPMNLRTAKPFLLTALLACSALANAATIEVQAVSATEPGKHAASCPMALLKHKAALLSSSYGAFADAGKQSVQLSAAAPHAQANLGAFNLEFTFKGANKVEVIVKDGDKIILAPFVLAFAKGKPRQLELTGATATTLVFLSLEKE
jgi:hypothetical protein